MVIRVSNKGIHRYKYTRKKICLKRKRAEEANMSFGEILDNIYSLKEKGIISASSVSSSITKAMKKYKCKSGIRR